MNLLTEAWRAKSGWRGKAKIFPQTGGRESIRRNGRNTFPQFSMAMKKEIAYAESVIAHPRTGTIPCMAVDSNGEHFRDDDDIRLVVEDSRARRGFPDHWRGLLRGQ